MKTAALIPVKQFESSKSRLDLTRNQKIVMTELMLKSTILALKKCKRISSIVTISADERVGRISKHYDVNFIFSKENGVNNAVMVGDEYCREYLINANIVVPIDLVFLDPSEIDLLLSIASKLNNCSIIVPSARMDGTNLLIRRPFDLYKTSYDNESYYNHLKSSRKSGAHTVMVKSPNLSKDLDTMDDYDNIIAQPTNRLSHLISRIQNIK
jgi:2-phospho-L-lactate/phosphoenolpyruvate guanylyltransferase